MAQMPKLLSPADLGRDEPIVAAFDFMQSSIQVGWNEVFWITPFGAGRRDNRVMSMYDDFQHGKQEIQLTMPVLFFATWPNVTKPSVVNSKLWAVCKRLFADLPFYFWTSCGIHQIPGAKAKAGQTWHKPPRDVVEKIERLLESGKSITAIKNHYTLVDYELTEQQVRVTVWLLLLFFNFSDFQ